MQDWGPRFSPGAHETDRNAAAARPAAMQAAYLGAYLGAVVWGVGVTASQALAEAAGSMFDRGADFDDVSRLQTAPLAPELLLALLEHGPDGAPARLVDGVLTLSAETSS